MIRQQRHKTIVALGSNTEQQLNLSKAMLKLDTLLTETKRSRRLWTAPIGDFSGEFLNMMVSGYTALTLSDFTTALKDIERECGRTMEQQHSGRVTVDIDIMEFDGERLHRDDWKRDYINTLSKEI